MLSLSRQAKCSDWRKGTQETVNNLPDLLLSFLSLIRTELQWGAAKSSSEFSEAWTQFRPVQHSTSGGWCRMSWWRTGGSSLWSDRAASASGYRRQQIQTERQQGNRMIWTNWKPNWCLHGTTSNMVCSCSCWTFGWPLLSSIFFYVAESGNRLLKSCKEHVQCLTDATAKFCFFLFTYIPFLITDCFKGPLCDKK